MNIKNKITSEDCSVEHAVMYARRYDEGQRDIDKQTRLRRRILIVGPLPPPSGGVATIINLILNSGLEKDFLLLHLDITRVQGIKNAGKIKKLS